MMGSRTKSAKGLKIAFAKIRFHLSDKSVKSKVYGIRKKLTVVLGSDKVFSPDESHFSLCPYSS